MDKKLSSPKCSHRLICAGDVMPSLNFFHEKVYLNNERFFSGLYALTSLVFRIHCLRR